MTSTEIRNELNDVYQKMLNESNKCKYTDNNFIAIKLAISFYDEKIKSDDYRATFKSTHHKFID